MIWPFKRQPRDHVVYRWAGSIFAAPMEDVDGLPPDQFIRSGLTEDAAYRLAAKLRRRDQEALRGVI